MTIAGLRAALTTRYHGFLAWIAKPWVPRRPILPEPVESRPVAPEEIAPTPSPPSREPRPAPQEPPGEEPLETFKGLPWSFAREAEDSGVFYFRGAILDRLDRYFSIIARMKLAHRSAYDLYSQVGAALTPQSALLASMNLSPHWKDRGKRPSFGASHIVPDKQDDEFVPSQLEFFHRQGVPPLTVERARPDEDVYEVTNYFDDHGLAKQLPWMKKCGFCFSHFVAVDAVCNIRPLKQLVQARNHAAYHWNASRTRKIRGADPIPGQYWGYSEMLLGWYADVKRRFHRQGWHFDHSLEQWVNRTFCNLVSHTERAEYGVRVNVVDKVGATAVFAIDQKRTAYFFRDRDPVITPKGGKAKIFHVVRPHMRALPSGKTLAVKMHFRGARKFAWNGYQVTVTVPGLHHTPVINFTPGMVDFDALPKEERKHLLDLSAIGGAWARHIDGAPLRFGGGAR